MHPPAATIRGRSTPAKGHSVKHLLPLLLVPVGLVIGAAGIVYGEGDDSPGLQLLGVLFVLAAVVFGVRTLRRGS